MLLSAATVAVIERKWKAAAGWCGAAAAISATGLMHSYRWVTDDTVLELRPAWPFVIAYGAMALLFLAAPLLTERSDESAPAGEHRSPLV
jgi:AGZA family xanthine/uracil permease-like MFS transporter